MTDDLVKRLRDVGYCSPEDVAEAADRIDELGAANDKLSCDALQLYDRIEKLEAVTKDDAKWLAAYHQWCTMNGCAPSSSDLISARKALEGKDE